jgi:cell division protein FtsL
MLTLVISFSLLGLVKVKVYVQDLREEITDMEKSKSKVGDEIQVLKAEWSNLNRPERIKILADKYLKLNNVNTKNIRNLDENSQSSNLRFTNVKNEGISVHVNWRYKSREVILKTAKDR